MLDYFKPIELDYDEKTNEIVAPTFRQDLFRTGRSGRGGGPFLSAMTISRPPFREERQPPVSFRSKLRIEAVARDIAEFCGFSQGMTYSFESPKVFDKLLLIPEDHVMRQAIVISNPLGEDFSYHENYFPEWHADFSGDQL